MPEVDGNREGGNGVEDRVEPGDDRCDSGDWCPVSSDSVLCGTNLRSSEARFDLLLSMA